MRPKIGALDLGKIKKVLKKTGHIFEYQVAHMFEQAGWFVIPNKFYLDKDEEKGREIDLIAYHIDEVRDSIAVVTVVIVESKQSYKNKWVFFTKGEYLGNVNIESRPLFYFSEIDEINRAITQDNMLQPLVMNDLNMIYDFPNKAYCYSEVVAQRGTGPDADYNYTAVNPTDIYGSIFPVIKAMTSELEFYKNRKIAKDEKRFYWVFPLVVFNGDMLEARISPTDDDLTLIPSDEFQYVTRYRSKMYDDFYSVNIINWHKLDRYIKFYDKAHKAIINNISGEIDKFYSNIDTKSFELIWYRVLEKLQQSNYFSGFNKDNFFPRYYSKARNQLEILVSEPRLFEMLSGHYPYDYKGKIEKILAQIYQRKITVDFTNVPISVP